MARLPRAETPAAVVAVRLSPAERARAEEAARVNQQRRSDFVRDAIAAAADDCLERRADPRRRDS